MPQTNRDSRSQICSASTLVGLDIVESAVKMVGVRKSIAETRLVSLWARSSDPFILRGVVSVVRSSLLASLGEDSRFVSFYEEVQSKETAKLASARQHETHTEECPEPEKSTVSSRTT